MTKKSAEYLHHVQFVVYRDNNPFMHLSSAKVGSLEQRWAAQLASFQFENKYRPGCINQSADALSRFPSHAAMLDVEEERESVEIPSFAHVRACVATAMCVGAGKANRENLPNTKLGMPFYLEHTLSQGSRLQGEDPALSRGSWYLQRGHRTNKQERQQESKLVLCILQNWECLSLIEGV